MIKRLNIYYLFISISLYIILIGLFGSDYILIEAISFTLLFTYIFVINLSISFRKYNYKNLLIIVFIYQLTAILLFNIISYYYNGNFFMFSEADSFAYDAFAKSVNNTSWEDGIATYLKNYEVDDLGMLVLLSLIYAVIESNIALNIFNIFVTLITCFALFDVGRHFMSDKYSFLATLYYSIASYTIWFNASGLKESFMIMLVVMFFCMYINYYKTGKLKFLIYAFLILSPVFFFRTILIFFCIVAVGLSSVFDSKISYSKVISYVLVILTLILGFPYIEAAYERFAFSGDIDTLIYARETQNMIRGGLEFTYYTNLLAQLIGPLPTLSSSISPLLSFYSQGLIMRVLLSFFFFMGTYYIIKDRVVLALPILFFILIEMILLSAILEGLELRKSLPHIPFIYLVSFWYIEKLSNKNKQYNSVILFTTYTVITFTLILGWNLR